ncbi:unnamed protein product [Ectocarpus sp. 6 AP-2014]
MVFGIPREGSPKLSLSSALSLQRKGFSVLVRHVLRHARLTSRSTLPGADVVLQRSSMSLRAVIFDMISLDVLTLSVHHMGEQGRFSEGTPSSIALAFCTTKGRGSNRTSQ